MSEVRRGGEADEYVLVKNADALKCAKVRLMLEFCNDAIRLADEGKFRRAIACVRCARDLIDDVVIEDDESGCRRFGEE